MHKSASCTCIMYMIVLHSHTDVCIMYMYYVHDSACTVQSCTCNEMHLDHTVVFFIYILRQVSQQKAIGNAKKNKKGKQGRIRRTLYM